MPSNHLPVPKRSYATGLMAIGLIVTMGFTAICGIVLREIGRSAYDRAQQSAANVVATVSADISRNLEFYDLSLQAVVEGMNLPDVAQMSPSIRQLFLFDRAATAQHLGSIFVLDKMGTVVIDSRTLQPSDEDQSDKDYFQVYRQNPNLDRYLSRPWVAPNGEYLISISRRMSGPDGSFQGVVVGTMRLSFFHDLFRKVNMHEGDALTLARRDGTIVMRLPFDFDVIGRSVAATAVFQRIARLDLEPFEAVAGIDGVKRLYVFQPVGDYPLIVSYGLSLETVFAGWWREASIIGLIVILLCGTNIALIVFLARALKRRSAAEYELAINATTDVLTGLCNRRRFDEIFDKEWCQAQLAQQPMGLLVIDADHFKAYNDRFGHQAGDVALIAIADCIAKGVTCHTDLVARYGGEEFVVLLPGRGLEEALGIADAIRFNIICLRTQQQGRTDSTPTISVGVASMVPREGLYPRDLFKAADTAVYEAKLRGRNRTEPASEVIWIGEEASLAVA